MTPDEIIQRLNEVGEWTDDKRWEQNAIAAEAQRVIKRLKANHKDAVETKRRTDARLRAALAALQKIYDISGDGFEQGSHEQPRNADPAVPNGNRATSKETANESPDR